MSKEEAEPSEGERCEHSAASWYIDRATGEEFCEDCGRSVTASAGAQYAVRDGMIVPPARQPAAPAERSILDSAERTYVDDDRGLLIAPAEGEREKVTRRERQPMQLPDEEILAEESELRAAWRKIATLESQLAAAKAENERLRRKLAEAEGRILADEERCKLTGDALSAEAELSALTAEVERLRSAVRHAANAIRVAEPAMSENDYFCEEAEAFSALAASADGQGKEGK